MGSTALLSVMDFVNEMCNFAIYVVVKHVTTANCYYFSSKSSNTK